MISCMISCNLWYHRSCHIMYHVSWYLISCMISYIIHDIIHAITISTFHALQPPILPRHSVLMQLTMIVNLTDQWISSSWNGYASADTQWDQGSTRWLSGCGARPGPPAAAPGWCLSPRLRGPAPKGSVRAGSGRPGQRRGSVAARQRLQQWGRPKAAFKLEWIEHCPMISCIISYFISYVWYHG